MSKAERLAVLEREVELIEQRLEEVTSVLLDVIRKTGAKPPRAASIDTSPLTPPEKPVSGLLEAAEALLALVAEEEGMWYPQGPTMVAVGKLRAAALAERAYREGAL